MQAVFLAKDGLPWYNSTNYDESAGNSMTATNASRQENRQMMMLNEPIGRVIFKMAIPTIVAFLINSIYSLADTYFVSSLGTNATAAVK